MHFYYLDILRGLASLSILVWHYQGFYFEHPDAFFNKRSTQPFYSILHLFYERGYLAVQLFWAISGFVFTSVYLEREGSGRQFVINRFARLYPLHFLTLIVVAILQSISFYTLNEYQIYSYNDLYHFLLNLAFIPRIGIEKGYSFNAPIWSVSVELLSYFCFYFSLKLLKKNPFAYALLFSAAFWLINRSFSFSNKAFTDCAYFFYLGVTSYSLIKHLKFSIRSIFVIATTILILSWFASKYRAYGTQHLSLLFSGTILLLSAFDLTPKLYAIGKRFGKFGDISYGIYLWHIPIQIFILLIIKNLSVDRSLLDSKWFFVLFFILVITIAQLSYSLYEKPMRAYFSNR